MLSLACLVSILPSIHRIPSKVPLQLRGTTIVQKDSSFVPSCCTVDACPASNYTVAVLAHLCASTSFMHDRSGLYFS